jgi:hypothetical protein
VNAPSQYMEVLRTGADDGAQVEVRFGVGGLVPAAGCGFWQACLCARRATHFQIL